MRSAHPVAVIALYAVVSVGVMALALEAMHWLARWRRPGGPITTDEYDIETLRRHARRRAAEHHARRTGGAA